MCLYVNRTAHNGISRGSGKVTAKKCTKKCDARAKFFLLINPMLLFLTFPLPSPSSVFKLPMTKESEPTYVNCIKIYGVLTKPKALFTWRCMGDPR